MLVYDRNCVRFRISIISIIGLDLTRSREKIGLNTGKNTTICISGAIIEFVIFFLELKVLSTSLS